MRVLRRQAAVFRRSIRTLSVVLAVAPALASLAALAALAPGSPLVSSCAGAGSGHAALIVQHGDGSVVARCVAFGTATVTGEQLLDSSGVAWSRQTFGGFGDAVCALDGEPAHYATCPGKDSYWAVFVSRGGGAWQFASAGISTLTLSDGDAEGFRYVPAAGTPVAPPSPVGVCAAAVQSAGAPASAGATIGPATTPHGVVPGITAGTAAGSASGRAAATGAPATSPGGVAAASGSGDQLVAAASAKAGGGSTGPAAANASPDAEPNLSARSPGPKPGSGVDLGLLAAALAGGGLGGLALLRLLSARRAAP